MNRAPNLALEPKTGQAVAESAHIFRRVFTVFA